MARVVGGKLVTRPITMAEHYWGWISARCEKRGQSFSQVLRDAFNVAERVWLSEDAAMSGTQPPEVVAEGSRR